MYRSCSSGSSPAHWLGFEAHPGANHLSTRGRLLRGVTFLGPIRFPQHLFIFPRSRDSYARAGSRSSYQCLRRPDCTLSRLRAEECDGPVNQSIATPEPGCPDPHTRSSAVPRWSPGVCHHTREPTVLSRVSCRPLHLNVDRFHQLCLVSWAHFQNR